MEDEKNIKDLLQGMMKSYRLNDKYDEVSVLNSWEQIVGEMIARKTTGLYIKNKIMYVQLSSAPLKSELRYHKAVILEKVNTFAGKAVIKDIQIN